MQIRRLLLATTAALGLAPAAAAQAIETWVAKPKGDQGVSIVADASGIYVTGTTLNDAEHLFQWQILTVKYDAAGNELWKKEFQAPAGPGFQIVPSWMALDPFGNVVITGRQVNDMLTLKYAPDGTLLWFRYHEARTGKRVACDAAGNIYVAADPTGVPSSRDFVTVKYDPAGNELWTRSYDGPNHFDDQVNALAVTADGDVAVAGQSTGGVTKFDFAVVRYDTDGNELWVRRYDNPEESGNDYGRDVAFGPSLAVYVVGASVGEGTGLDATLVAYGPTGAELWVHRLDGPVSGIDEGHRVAVDPFGDVVTIAESQQSDFTPAFVTTKHAPSGAVLWSQVRPSEGAFASVPHALAIGPDGDVHVTGDGGLSQTDYLTVKYDAAGDELWAMPYLDPDPQTDTALAIALLPDGDVAVTGGYPFTVVLYEDGVPASEVVRVGSPPNPAALLPGATVGPVLGATWDPRIDHALLPGAPAGVDLLGVGWVALVPGVATPAYGTLLVDPGAMVGIASAAPGAAFQIALPSVAELAGVALATQGAAVDVAAGAVVLTNALDVVIGTYDPGR